MYVVSLEIVISTCDFFAEESASPAGEFGRSWEPAGFRPTNIVARATAATHVIFIMP